MILNLIRKNTFLYRIALRAYAAFNKCGLTFSRDFIDIQNNNQTIRLSSRNINFVREIIDFFDFYFFSVSNSKNLVDFSGPNLHTLTSFGNLKIWFPSTSEPVSTLEQYQKILQIKTGEVVIDLGSYSGLSSIFFNSISKSKVISVEADPKNIVCCQKNMEIHRELVLDNVVIYPFAISNKNGFQNFSSDGTMASQLIQEITQKHPQKNLCKVETRTLSQLVKDLSLDKVDVIKADIEGSEFSAFQDRSFFETFQPRIILEPINLKEAVKIESQLRSFGYSKFNHYRQYGSKQELMLCQK